MRYTTYFFLLLILFFAQCESAPVVPAASPSEEKKPRAALLMDRKSGKVLFEEHANELYYPASITKIATALYLYEGSGADLDGRLIAQGKALLQAHSEQKKKSGYTLAPYLLEENSASIAIREGEEFLLRDLFYALLIRSANDAANVMAYHAAGSLSRFTKEFDRYLRTLGMQKSRLLNPHGLHHPHHVATAFEIAQWMRRLLTIPFLAKVVATSTYQLPKTNLSPERSLKHSSLFFRKGPLYYSKVYGAKTGSHRAAGFTLVAAAKDDQRDLICVILNATSKEECHKEAMMLFEQAFQEKKVKIEVASIETRFDRRLEEEKATVHARLDENFFFEEYPSMHRGRNIEVTWTIPSLPIQKGDLVGLLSLKDEDGSLLAERELFATETIYPLRWKRMLLIFIIAPILLGSLHWLSDRKIR